MRKNLVLSFASLVGALAVTAAPAPAATAAKCGLGSVRGIAFVTGDPKKGLANLPDTFSSSATLFGYRWNCSGGVVSIRGASGGFDVKFAGNPGRFAVVSSNSEVAAGAVKQNADGTFHVSLAGNAAPDKSSFGARSDVSFVIIVF
jgi:hypothetical protein